MKPTFKVVLFWLAVLVAAIVVYLYANYQRAQALAAAQESSNAR
jgi:uncharacterized membrane protein (DUF106 family)